MLRLQDAAQGVGGGARRLRLVGGQGGIGLNLLGGRLTVLALTHIGPELPPGTPGVNVNSALRYISDITATWKISDALTSITDVNYIHDDGLHASGGGVAQYVTYALSDQWSVGVRGEVVGQNELALYSALFETHDQASLAAFLEATIGPLLAYDRKRSSELAATLLTYFDCNQNAKTTAQRLDIHVNTVRQRLATTEELLGHWGNATRALEIHIALRLWSLGGG